jgi:RNA polymerase sigma-70 factor (ECF subfamily)
MGSDTSSGTGSLLLLVLSDPANPQFWAAFVDRYGPKIYGWCRQRGLQEADAQDVTQEVLTQLVQKLRAFTYDPHKGSFRAWLKTLTHHAWCDYLESRRRAGGDTAGAAIQERLETLEAREDLLKALEESFDLEVLEEAKARVRLRVTPRDWQIFEDLALGGRSGPAVARELKMSVSATLMAKSRVQKKLREEIRRLEGTGPEKGKR